MRWHAVACRGIGWQTGVFFGRVFARIFLAEKNKKLLKKRKKSAIIRK
jgi:hypothetical protein